MPLSHPKKEKGAGIWIILRISFGNLELGEYILTPKKKRIGGVVEDKEWAQK